MPGETHKPEERLEGKRWWRCRVCKAQVPKSKPACSLGHLRPDPEQGINENGVQMCECKRYGPPHAWEPGESCSPERVIPAASKPPTHTPVGASDEGEWPVLTLKYSKATNHYLDMDPDDGFRHDQSEYETYYPASHPAVLGDDERERLKHIADGLERLAATDDEFFSRTIRQRDAAFLHKLSSYAQKEGGDGS